jgi:hypothetical protein
MNLSSVTKKEARGHALSIFPPLLPEEALWGYIARTTALNMAIPSEARHQLFGDISAYLSVAPSLFPVKIASLVKASPAVFVSIENLANFHTVYPLLTWCLSRDGSREVMRRFRCGEKQRVPLGVSNVGSAYPRHCPICAANDLNAFGTAYWHRVNQLAFVSDCSEHDTPLLEGCGACDYKHLLKSDSPLPSPKCVCGAEHRQVLPMLRGAARDPARGISRLALEMLETEEPLTLQGISGRAIRLKMNSSGIGSEVKPFGGRLHRTMTESGDIETMRSMKFGGLKLSSFTLLCRGARWENAVLRTAVLHRLFGTLDAYVSFGFMALGFEREAGILPSAKSIQAARATIRSTMVKLGTNSRTAIGRAAMKAVKIAVNFDREWYEKTIPASYKGVPPRPEKAFALRDRARAHEVRRRATEILALPGAPVAVTKSSIFSTLPSNHTYHPGVLTNAALLDVVETIAVYRARCVNWALKNREIFESKTELTDYLRQRMGPGARAKISHLELQKAPITEADMLSSVPRAPRVDRDK